MTGFLWGVFGACMAGAIGLGLGIWNEQRPERPPDPMDDPCARCPHPRGDHQADTPDGECFRVGCPQHAYEPLT